MQTEVVPKDRPTVKQTVWKISILGILTLCNTVVYFTKGENPSLAKPPLNFNGGLAKLGSPP